MNALNNYYTLGRQLTIGEAQANFDTIEAAINVLEGTSLFYEIVDLEQSNTCTDLHGTVLSLSFKVKLLLDHPSIPVLKTLVRVNDKVRKLEITSTSIFNGADWPLVADTISDTINITINLSAADYPAAVKISVYDERGLRTDDNLISIEEDPCEFVYNLVFDNSSGGDVNISLLCDTATIDWGDGTITAVSGENIFYHTYAEEAESYHVRIWGGVQSIYTEETTAITELRQLPDTLTYINIHSCPALASPTLSYYPNLEYIGFDNCGLTDIDISDNPALNYVNLQSNSLSQDAVNHVLNTLAAGGVDDGALQLSGQTPSRWPTGDAVAAIATLEGRGWTVYVDTEPVS